MDSTNQSNDNYTHLWLVVVFVLMLLGLTLRCQAQNIQKAQVDTVYCNVDCIEKYVSTTTQSGRTKTYAVYNDRNHNISELIPVSKTVLDYISLCDANGIMPTLGIRIRNGQISSIVRYKQKIRITHEKR